MSMAVPVTKRSLIRRHWKRLLWAWLFPLGFFASIAIPHSGKNPLPFFFLVQAPAFFFCFYMASEPVRKREMTPGQAFVLIFLVPFLIWASLIGGIFGLVFLASYAGAAD